MQMLRCSVNRAIGVGEFISSEKFNVGGSDWVIRYYPDGCSHRSKKYISVYLELKSDNAEVRAWFAVRLLGKTQKSGWRIGTTRLFKGGPGSRSLTSGWEKFLERKLLEETTHDLLWNNRLAFECWVNVVKKPLVSGTSMSSFTLPPSELSGDFGNLLESKEGADITFLVKGEAFAAHKVVLAARSSVFKAEFCGPMIEKEASYITVEEMEPAAFKALLHFIYTDSLGSQLDGLEFTDANELLRHLLVAADRYGMERLKAICEMELCKTINVETLAALSERRGCSFLAFGRLGNARYERSIGGSAYVGVVHQRRRAQQARANQSVNAGMQKFFDELSHMQCKIGSKRCF
ncbi:hypothetical protein E2562_032075 [Oryza meyeriana var. granulata]|uniref:BTB domain-containing protein n=1 Tax=Oryza meyeriana var. granulata TaxID=110450 RepID=A0A6G1CK91_9ORYZ|nr:hypothetical protein E2562_032075 [Oryza meyeriana var. granulata]